MFASARQYQSYFPVLTKRLEMIGKVERETVLDQTKVPVISICLVYKKVRDVGFMGTVETSTSVGNLPTDVLKNYES